MAIKAIITGSTGMVGEGVLHECLNHPDVESVLVINRRSCGKLHPKLTEILHSDFTDFSEIEELLTGYNSAYLCMGTTSFRMSEKDYANITYEMTLALARTLARLNPDLSLCYVSGMGSDSTEAGKLMWTRIKGKTENTLLKLPLKQAFMFRAGIIQPTKGLDNTYLMYKLGNPVLPLLRKLFPKLFCSLEEIGLAMIETSLSGFDKPIVDVLDMVTLASKNKAKD
ncbi:MAG: NAD-dependent epimerase/dehydratase family protein [Candidatus Marinimicrobia bacterium]|nr:NAD-dependent epimerase/dehydratase family protein [Candidatus Neomarinimicrobiota bacterium]